MKTLAFINRKGGVSKTTSALAFAAYLAQHDKKVLALDMDAQSNFTTSSGGERDVKGVLDFLMGEPLSEVLQTSTGGYDFIGADRRLSKADDALPRIGREFVLRQALENIDDYDFVVIDTPPAMETLTLAAMVSADETIIPCRNDSYTIDGLSELRGNLDAVRKCYNQKLKVAGLLRTYYKSRAKISQSLDPVLEQAAAAMNTKVFSATIREDTKLKEAEMMQQDIYSYAPTSHGAEDYAAAAEEFLREAD